MNEQTNETVRLIDLFAKTAHDIVDRLQQSAVSIESLISRQSEETGKRVKTEIAREASELEKYVEENPAVSAVIAFALGVAATRVMKSKESAEPQSETTEAA